MVCRYRKFIEVMALAEKGGSSLSPRQASGARRDDDERSQVSTQSAPPAEAQRPAPSLAEVNNREDIRREEEPLSAPPKIDALPSARSSTRKQGSLGGSDRSRGSRSSSFSSKQKGNERKTDEGNREPALTKTEDETTQLRQEKEEQKEKKEEGFEEEKESSPPEPSFPPAPPAPSETVTKPRRPSILKQQSSWGSDGFRNSRQGSDRGSGSNGGIGGIGGGGSSSSSNSNSNSSSRSSSRDNAARDDVVTKAVYGGQRAEEEQQQEAIIKAPQEENTEGKAPEEEPIDPARAEELRLKEEERLRQRRSGRAARAQVRKEKRQQKDEKRKAKEEAKRLKAEAAKAKEDEEDEVDSEDSDGLTPKARKKLREAERRDRAEAALKRKKEL